MSDIVRDILIGIVGNNKTAAETLTHFVLVKKEWDSVNKLYGFTSAIHRGDNRIRFLERYRVRDE